jgi:hypothetical protein
MKPNLIYAAVFGYWILMLLIPFQTFAGTGSTMSIPVVLAFVESGDARLDSEVAEARGVIRQMISAEFNKKNISFEHTISAVSANSDDEIRSRLKELGLDTALVITARISGGLAKKLTLMYQGVAKIQLALMTYRFEEGELMLADIDLNLKKKIMPVSRWSDDREKQMAQFGKIASKMVKKWPMVASAEFVGDVHQLKAELDLAYGDDIPGLLTATKPAPEDPRKWLLVIGIQNYRNTDHIRYAKRSAELFAEVVQHTFGVKKENSFVLLDSNATAGGIKNKLRLLLENVKEGDTIYFYYNGHGVPVKNRDGEPEPYLLPQDGMAAYIQDESFFKLHTFYKSLTDSKAAIVVAFIDSCFSGATDDKSVFKGVAAPRLVPRKIRFDKKKMVILAAGQKTQYSNMYPKKKHRLFSYFLMKSLLSKKRSMTEIFNDISPKVEDASRAMGPLKKQQPTLEGNRDIRL